MNRQKIEIDNLERMLAVTKSSKPAELRDSREQEGGVSYCTIDD